MARKNTLQAHERRTRALMTAPMAAFGVLLVALPLIYVLCTSLVTGGKFQFGMPLTLANYKALLREDYLKVFANSLQLAFFTTVISLLVGYPFGYCMARAPRKWKALLMMLVIIPFWTSALVRIYGWKILLQANGPVNGVLRSLGLIQKNIKFLGSYGSVLLAMVYCLISFMILPCHNAVDKIDFTLVEASRDLGASPVRAFLTVTLPLPMLPDAVNTPFSIVPTLPCTVQVKPLLSPSTGRWRYIAEAVSFAVSPALTVMALQWA
mgnify:CR=1 FL=1